MTAATNSVADSLVHSDFGVGGMGGAREARTDHYSICDTNAGEDQQGGEDLVQKERRSYLGILEEIAR
jgi:hypothetical protein